MRVHLDTDLGGNPDDACALALVLGWPGAELVAVTTSLDPRGHRAGCAEHVLELAGREGVEVAAGAGASLSTLRQVDSTWADPRYWPEPVVPRPCAPGRALDLLARSAASGATIAVTGAFTNLALLAVARPGMLRGVRVVVMGGWVDPPGPGLPQWGPERDTNVQLDLRAAEVVLASGADLTLVPFAVTLQTQLRTAHLPRLRQAGPLGQLLARQAEAHAENRDLPALARHHRRLADDLLNFHHDPLACAVALGWAGVTTHSLHLAARVEDGVLRLRPAADGHAVTVAVAVDSAAFEEAWLASVEAASRRRW